MRTLVLKLLLAALVVAPAARAGQRPAAESRFDRIAADAAAARDANRVEEAADLYQKALALEPTWAEGWWYLGTLFYEGDNFADAAVAFERSAKLSPKLGTTWTMLGLCEFKLEKYDDALAHLREGLRLGVDSAPQIKNVALYHVGLLLLAKGEYENAHETLASLAREGVDDDNLVVAIGLSSLLIGFKDLLADATKGDLVRRVGRAEALSAAAKFDEAAAAWGAIVADFPSAPNVNYAYGRFLVSTSESEKAVAAFKREIELAPNHLPARLAIADTEFKLRNFADGVPYAEEAVRLAPRLPVAHFLLGALLLGADQPARAIPELESARASLPNEAQVYYQLARAYDKAGRRDDAARARAAFTKLQSE